MKTLNGKIIYLVTFHIQCQMKVNINVSYPEGRKLCRGEFQCKNCVFNNIFMVYTVQCTVQDTRVCRKNTVFFNLSIFPFILDFRILFAFIDISFGYELTRWEYL